MTWVKICGITNLEDALVAVDAGADAVGFVFYDKSPRCVTVETAREIVSKLPESVEKIGVFVDVDSDPVNVLLQTGLSGTQCYLTAEGFAGRRSGAIGMSLAPPRFKNMIAMPVSLFGGEESEFLAGDFSGFGKNVPAGVTFPEGVMDTFLLDSGSQRQPGGTGKAFDWKRAVLMAADMKQVGIKLVVAGGLTPQNVGEAMEILEPWGVDVSSGVETSPGKKDPEKVRAFVRAVREIDRRVG
jgi:phosphoribosylanthranilate isomerase